MRRYSLYGAVIEVDHPLSAPVPETVGEPEVRIRRVSDLACPDADPVVAIPEPPAPELVTLHTMDGRWRLGIAGAGAFLIGRDEIRYRPADHGPRAEVHLLGTVMALWLEISGVPAFHASAVEWDGRGIAFLGGNRSGKSSIALQLVREGGRLLTDDLLAVRHRPHQVLGAPGYPQLRLWPEEAEVLVGDVSHLGRAHPDFGKLRVPLADTGLGELAPDPVPLEALYVLERGDELEVAELEGAEAVVELTRHAFAAPFLTALDRSRARLVEVTRLASEVTVRRLWVTGGADTLAEVTELVLEDLDSERW